MVGKCGFYSMLVESEFVSTETVIRLSIKYPRVTCGIYVQTFPFYWEPIVKWWPMLISIVYLLHIYLEYPFLVEPISSLLWNWMFALLTNCDFILQFCNSVIKFRRRHTTSHLFIWFWSAFCSPHLYPTPFRRKKQYHRTIFNSFPKYCENT